MKKFALAAMMTLVVALTSNNVFAEYVIDEFDTPGFPNQQRLRVNNSVEASLGNTVHNGSAAAGVLGGIRDMQLSRQNPVGSTYLDANQVTSGLLTYVQSQTSSTDDVDGAFAITWDGDSDGGGAANVDSNPGALAGASPAPNLTTLNADLTQGGINNAIQLTNLSNSVSLLSLTLEIYDAVGLASTYTLAGLAPGNAQTLTILFSQFSDSTVFDSVHAVKLLVDVDHSVGGGVVTLDKISAVSTRVVTTPEPSSVALLGIGAISLLMGRKLRRRKAVVA